MDLHSEPHEENGQAQGKENWEAEEVGQRKDPQPSDEGTIGKMDRQVVDLNDQEDPRTIP